MIYICLNKYKQKNRLIFLNHSLIFALLSLLLFTSCEDTLLEEPKAVSEENFYNTFEEVETAVNAVYLPLRQTWLLVGFNSAHTDHTFGRGSWAALNSYEGLNGTWVNRMSSVWVLYYESIRNANIVIDVVPNAESLNPDDIAKFIAEAKFLRAFSYFQLVKHWGGVPIRTEANIDNADTKRSSVEDVYALIVSDLEEAIDVLPITPSISGKPSVGAAKTILADVYLNLNKFTEASALASEVINSKIYSLVPVQTTDDFQNIFGPNVVTTSEEIFYLKFSHDVGQGDLWPWLLQRAGTGFHGAGGVFGVHSDSNSFVHTNWDDDDLRKGQWFNWDLGLGPTSLLSKKLIDPDAVGGAGAGNPQTWYRYADILLIYAEAAGRVADAPTVESMEALNQVHRRAFGYDPTMPSPVDFIVGDYDGTTFLELIIKERGYEFQLEGKRWSELIRTGKLSEIILEAKGKVVLDLELLLPIPVNELNANGELDSSTDQNPGY